MPDFGLHEVECMTCGSNDVVPVEEVRMFLAEQHPEHIALSRPVEEAECEQG